MKTLLTLILIPVILIGPYAVKLSMHRASGPAIEGVAKQQAMKLQSVDQIADLIIAGFITAAFILAFLIFRFTFGIGFPQRLTLLRYTSLALVPTILFALTFFINPPGKILAIFSGLFGSSASGIIFGVAFIYGIITHLISCLVVGNSAAKAE